MKTATSNFFKGETVKYRITKDFLGNTTVAVKYPNGEVTTMSEKRFNEMFTRN